MDQKVLNYWDHAVDVIAIVVLGVLVGLGKLSTESFLGVLTTILGARFAMRKPGDPSGGAPTTGAIIALLMAGASTLGASKMRAVGV